MKVGKFFTSVADDWLAKMSGPLTVPFTVAALYVSAARYKALFFVLAMVAALTTCYRVWVKQYDRVEGYKKLFSTMPRLRAKELHTETVLYQYGDGSQPSKLIGSALLLKIHNDPMFPVPEANASKVGAKLTFYDSKGSELFNFDGRWAQTDQPSIRDIRQSKADLLSVDIPIGQSRDIDIAMKYPLEADAYGFNNDSYFHFHYQNPAWKLTGDSFTVEVRVRGTYVDNIWRIRFKNTLDGLIPDGEVQDIQNFLTCG